MEQKPVKLELVSIRTDGGTQPRAAIDPATVAEYREEMQRGDQFPPVICFFDGRDHWLADGFHRVRAAVEGGRKYIQAEVRQGTQRDAILCSVGANQTHGARRTNADKRRAVERLLRDEEWAQWSNCEIGRRCGVDEGTVRNYRAEVTTEIPKSKPTTTPHPKVLRRTSDGRIINTANIGRGHVEPGSYREEDSGIGIKVSHPRPRQAKPKPKTAPVAAPPVASPFARVQDMRTFRCPHCGQEFEAAVGERHEADQ